MASAVRRLEGKSTGLVKGMEAKTTKDLEDFVAVMIVARFQALVVTTSMAQAMTASAAVQRISMSTPVVSDKSSAQQQLDEMPNHPTDDHDGQQKKIKP